MQNPNRNGGDIRTWNEIPPLPASGGLAAEQTRHLLNSTARPATVGSGGGRARHTLLALQRTPYTTFIHVATV